MRSAHEVRRQLWTPVEAGFLRGDRASVASTPFASRPHMSSDGAVHSPASP